LIQAVIGAREQISPNAVLMVADADIWSFPLLALSGVDLFGDSHASASGTTGEMLFESYSVEADKMGPGSCPCPICREAGAGKNSLGHNRWMMSKVLAEMRNRITLGELKLMVEERATGHPEVNAALKGLYLDCGEYLEKHTTVVPGVRN
jgi:predicted RNA-binding protein